LFDKPEPSIDQGTTEKATVTRVLEERTQDSPNGPELYQRLELQINGQPVVMDRTTGKNDSRNFEINAGDKLLVTGAPSGPNGETVYFISDRARDGSLLALFLAFAVVVILVGRLQGALSIVGMALSLLVILRFIIPGILDGYDPVLITVLGAIVIMASSLYLSHGINRKTTMAFLGTGIALALTAVLAGVGISLTNLSGLADEQAATLRIITDAGIQPEGLLLAGIIIGALGVLDDVCVAQASAVFELKAANPALHGWDLFERAMNIGRDHIASTVNTLFLAYAGAALPLMIILSLGTEPTSVLINRDFLATEIVRTLIGSMGIVASVPLTTALAAWSLRVARDAA
jgi:uncharacterized membrane protein